jgi:predicted amidohydrolase YtcJ
MKRCAVVAVLLAAAFAGSATAFAGSQDPRLTTGAADTILIDGKIMTVDAKDTMATAVAVRSGRLIAVGATREILRYSDSHTEVIHLGGRTVLPGFIDAHTHLEGIAEFHRMLDIHAPPLKDVDAILDKVRQRVEAVKPGEWVIGAGGWGQPLPTRAQLDAIAPRNPVVLRESAHLQVLNSLALKMAGIGKDSVPPTGGHIFRDPKSGELTGRIQEMAFVWSNLMPPPSKEARKQSLQEVMQQFVKYGVTTIYDFPSGDGIKLYQELREESRLPVRLRLQIMVDGGPLTPRRQGFKDFVLDYGPRTGFGDDWLKLGGIKLFVDGETQSAVRYEPPGQRTTWVGDLRYSQEELNAIVLQAHEAGFQVWIHAVGNKAQDMALDAYENAQRQFPRADARHRIEHAGDNESGTTSDEQYERMRQLGVIPVPTGAWIKLADGGEKPAYVSFPYRTMLKHGLRPPGSSDSLGSMPESMNPFFAIWEIVTRETHSGEKNAPQESISAREAIRGYTMNGAYSAFEEKGKGSIEAGKFADLIVVSDDPLTIDQNRLKDIHVLMTMIDGRVTYRSDEWSARAFVVQ